MNPASLTVLHVEDNIVNQVLVRKLLENEGLSVVSADSGEMAISVFLEKEPDLILIDICLDGMDGIKVAGKIRTLSDRWVPIVFVSSMDSDEDILHGLSAGGDDYITKPIKVPLFQAKIRVMIERIMQNKQLVDYQEHLLAFKQKAEEENALAWNFMQRVAFLNRLSRPWFAHYLRPASGFSGDLVAAETSSDGRIYALLADSTGHGLTSALAAVPVAQPFYAMSAKGFGVDAIARSINKKVREYLPVGHFVAANIFSFDPMTGQIEAWCGGCPPALLVNENGGEIHRFQSKNVPLGILPNDRFPVRVERFQIDDVISSPQLVLYSDGLPDFLGSGRTAYGSNLLSRALRMYGDRLKTIDLVKSMINARINNRMVAKDDIAVAVVQLKMQNSLLQAQNNSPHSNPDLNLFMTGSRPRPIWKLDFTFTAEQIKRLDVVPEIIGILRRAESSWSEIESRFPVILTELYVNAVDHGLLGLSSAQKTSTDGFDKFYSEREKRLSALTNGWVRIKISRHDGFMYLAIEDSGDGFSKSDLSCEQNPSLPFGRGLPLVEKLCKLVRLPEGGSAVEAILSI